MNGPTTENEYQTCQCGSGANVETSDDRMQIASLTRRMQVHNTDVYTPLGVGVYTCVNGPMTGAVTVSPLLSPLFMVRLFAPLRVSPAFEDSKRAMETFSLVRDIQGVM